MLAAKDVVLARASAQTAKDLSVIIRESPFRNGLPIPATRHYFKPNDSLNDVRTTLNDRSAKTNPMNEAEHGPMRRKEAQQRGTM